MSNHPSPAVVSFSDSDSDAYGGARGQAARKKQRQLKAAAAVGPVSQSEVRFSTRQAAKVTTYNEDQEEYDEEQDVASWEYIDPNDVRPVIDVVLDSRPKEETSKAKPKISDYQYLIKWQEKAHYHATWEDYASLTSLRGLKKLQNYYRALADHMEIMDSPEVSREEKEIASMERLKGFEEHDDFKKVERVVDVNENGSQYLVKWKKVDYDGCTWETASLVQDLARPEIDSFRERTRRLPYSDKTQSNVATRKTWIPFNSQPSYIKGGELRNFQIKGINFIAMNWCKGDNVILADEMGLGKTIQTVAFLSWLYHERRQEGPSIVVVPLSTMAAWAVAFSQWAPDMNVVQYSGNATARQMIRDREMFLNGDPRIPKFNTLITTYEYILKDAPELSPVHWQFVAVDEAHRLKNRDSKLYAKLMEFIFAGRLLITGTPIQNNLRELSALMNFLNPGQEIIDDEIDLQSEAASFKLAQLTEAIKPYMIRRTKAVVADDLPSKSEKIIRVELADVQLDLYKNILTRNYAALTSARKGDHVSLANTMIELKKASNHPYLFPLIEDRIQSGPNGREEYLRGTVTSSGKMMLLDQLLNKLKKDGHRVLIFSQLVSMLDIMGEYLKTRGHEFQRLDGTVPAATRNNAIKHFNQDDSRDFCFLLSTRAGGLGINLATADTVILFDSDWNPQVDLQAMARAHRIGQKKPVTIYRFVSKDTIEEEILERARNKLLLEYITIQRGVTDKDNEKAKIAKKMADAGHNTATATDSDDISRLLKKRSQKMFDQRDNQKKLEALDIDAVLENAEEHQTEQPEGLTTDGGEDFLKSFEYTDVKVDEHGWDDIIPPEQLAKIKEEEKKRKEEEYLASVIAQNAPRQRKAQTDDKRQRTAKKRAREAAAMAEVPEESSEDEIDEEADPHKKLDDKELKKLKDAHLKWGWVEDRPDEVLRDANLIGRDMGLVKTAMQDVLDRCHEAVQKEQNRLADLEKTGKTITKADKNTVTIEYRGMVRLNAATLIDRPDQLQVLRREIASLDDAKDFKVQGATKDAEQYTCPWGAREDGMLCVGIDRYGWGSWAQIRDDEELGMGDRLFLGEKTNAEKTKREKARTPGPVHLTRRATYLLSVLKATTSSDEAAQKAVENYHRNNKKAGSGFRRREKASRKSGSPAPGGIRKPSPHVERHQINGQSSANRHRTSSNQSSGKFNKLDKFLSTKPLVDNERRRVSPSSRNGSEPSSIGRGQKHSTTRQKHQHAKVNGHEEKGLETSNGLSTSTDHNHQKSKKRSHDSDHQPSSFRHYKDPDTDRQRKKPRIDGKPSQGCNESHANVETVKRREQVPAQSNGIAGGKTKEETKQENKILKSHEPDGALSKAGSVGGVEAEVEQFLEHLIPKCRATKERAKMKTGRLDKILVIQSYLVLLGNIMSGEASKHDEEFRNMCWYVYEIPLNVYRC